MAGKRKPKKAAPANRPPLPATHGRDRPAQPRQPAV